MAFTFKISSVTHLESVGAYLMEGFLEEGKFLSGQQGVIEGVGVVIRIKSVALVNSKSQADNYFTLGIEKPTVPLSNIESGMILTG